MGFNSGFKELIHKHIEMASIKSSFYPCGVLMCFIWFLQQTQIISHAPFTTVLCSGHGLCS